MLTLGIIMLIGGILAGAVVGGLAAKNLISSSPSDLLSTFESGNESTTFEKHGNYMVAGSAASAVTLLGVVFTVLGIFVF